MVRGCWLGVDIVCVVGCSCHRSHTVAANRFQSIGPCWSWWSHNATRRDVGTVTDPPPPSPRLAAHNLKAAVLSAPLSTAARFQRAVEPHISMSTGRFRMSPVALPQFGCIIATQIRNTRQNTSNLYALLISTSVRLGQKLPAETKNNHMSLFKHQL